MRHSVSKSAFGVCIRPVTMADAAYIVQLRTQPRVVGTVGDTSSDVEVQQQWINRYFDRDDDYYFIVEVLPAAPPNGGDGLLRKASRRLCPVQFSCMTLASMC